MSIGFPLAPAETGLSSAFVAQFQVRFRTRRCSGTSSDTVPLFWVETINIADFLPPDLPVGIVGKGKFVAKSDALALMNVGSGTPTNVTALHALAVQMAKDFTLWRSISHDITFNGTIASPPNGIMDTCEWTLLADNISTREITQNLNGEPEEFNHNDPANAGCIDVANQLITTKTPCVESYIPLWQGSVGTPSPFGAYRSKICLEDGRLIEYFNSEDILTCGCNSGNTCLTGIIIDIVTCNQNQANGVLISIQDNHGNTFTGTTSGTPPGRVVFLNFPCDMSATYTITISKTGFTTITRPFPLVCCQSNAFMYNLLANPLPMITVNFHIASCESGELDAACTDCFSINSMPGISGVIAGVTVNGVLISCVTNGNGDCTVTFPVNSNGARYPISASGGACVSPYIHNMADDVVDTCLTQTALRCVVLPVDPICNCFCCQNPRPSSLFLTDSIYGAVNLTWSLCADGTFRYTGTKTITFAGACGCPAADTIVNYFLQCRCITGNTVYDLFMCYTSYSFLEICGPITAQLHSCPGPIDPAHPGTICIPNDTPGPYCPRPGGVAGTIMSFPHNNNFLTNTTSKCAAPLHIIFSYVPTFDCVARGLPCNWGVLCPTPWPSNATFTVTQ